MTWCKKSWKDEYSEVGAATGSPTRVEGDARVEFVGDGKECSMKFLHADVKTPLASVGAIVDEGNIVMFGPQEPYIEKTSTGQRGFDEQEERRVCELDAPAGTRTTKTVMRRTRSRFSGGQREPTCGRNS